MRDLTDYAIHHIDGDPRNNDLENLALVRLREHSIPRRTVREIVWRATFGVFALFCYVMALASAGQQLDVAAIYALFFAEAAWLATNDAVEGL